MKNPSATRTEIIGYLAQPEALPDMSESFIVTFGADADPRKVDAVELLRWYREYCRCSA